MQPSTTSAPSATSANAPVDVLTCTVDMPDLAPMICRRRLVVEGTCRAPITGEQIRAYLAELSEVCDMRLILEEGDGLVSLTLDDVLARSFGPEHLLGKVAWLD